MSFSQVLSDYCRAIGCTGKQLAEASGIAPSTLSRYRNGSRKPAANAPEISKLAAGIASLAEVLGMDDYTNVEAIESDLSSSLEEQVQQPTASGEFAHRLGTMLTALHITNSEMSRMLQVDPSYLSRVRNRQRVPANLKPFAEQCAACFADRICADIPARAVADELMGGVLPENHTRRDAEIITCWLLAEPIPPEPELMEVLLAPQPELSEQESTEPEATAYEDAQPRHAAEMFAKQTPPELAPEVLPAYEPKPMPKPEATAESAPQLEPISQPEPASEGFSLEAPEPPTKPEPSHFEPALPDVQPQVLLDRPNFTQQTWEPQPSEQPEVLPPYEPWVSYPQPTEPFDPQATVAFNAQQSLSPVEPVMPFVPVLGTIRATPSDASPFVPDGAAELPDQFETQPFRSNEPQLTAPEKPASEPDPSLEEQRRTAADDFLSFFNQLDIPSAPPVPAKRRRAGFGVSSIKQYQGIGGIRDAQLDFLAFAAGSRAAFEVVLYSNICVEQPGDCDADLPEDDDFLQELIPAVGQAVAAGKRLSWIHVIDDCPATAFAELKRLLPLYLAGGVAAYWVPDSGSPLQNALFTCETAALRGECVAGYADEGAYALVRRHEDVDYLRLRAYRLLETSSRAFTVFRAAARPDFEVARMSHEQHASERRSLLAAPPLGTIPYDVLESMLSRSELSEDARERVRSSVSRSYASLVELCERGKVADTVGGVSEQGQALEPTEILLADGLGSLALEYTDDELKAHVDATAFFAKTHEGYSCSYRAERPYGQTEITVYPDECVVLGKGGEGQVHVVVEHPGLCEALAALVPLPRSQ